MHSRENEGSWGYVFAMELFRLCARVDLDVRTSIPEDYEGPFRGDIAFHATHPPGYAAYDCVRASVVGSEVFLGAEHQGEMWETFRSWDATQDPRKLACQVWHEYAHGAIAWMGLTRPARGSAQRAATNEAASTERVRATLSGFLKWSGFREEHGGRVVAYSADGKRSRKQPTLWVEVAGNALRTTLATDSVLNIYLQDVAIQDSMSASQVAAQWWSSVGMSGCQLVDHLTRLEQS